MPANPFALGGGLSDFEGETTDAVFMFNDKFTDNDGNPRMILAVDFESDVFNDGKITKFYTCGNGWEPAEGGKKAVRADDPDNDTANFNGGTLVGRLITSIVSDAAAADVIRARYEAGVGATDAAMFVGLRGTWGQIPYDYVNPETKEKGTNEFLGLKEFSGEVKAGGTAKKQGAKKQAAKKAAAKKAPAVEPESNGKLPDEMVAQVQAIFDEVENHEQFLERVVDEVEGAEDHLEYLTDVTEGAWAQLCAAQDG